MLMYIMDEIQIVREKFLLSQQSVQMISPVGCIDFTFAVREDVRTELITLRQRVLWVTIDNNIAMNTHYLLGPS